MTRVSTFWAVSSALMVIALSITGANAETLTPHVTVPAPKVTVKPPLVGHIQTSGVSTDSSFAKVGSDGKEAPHQTIQLTNGAVVNDRTWHGIPNTTGGTTTGRQRRSGNTDPLK